MRKAVLILGLILVASLSLAGVYGACSGTPIGTCSEASLGTCENYYMISNNYNYPCQLINGRCEPNIQAYNCKNYGCDSENSRCSLKNKGYCGFSPNCPQETSVNNEPFASLVYPPLTKQCDYVSNVRSTSSSCYSDNDANNRWVFRKVTGETMQICERCDANGHHCDYIFSVPSSSEQICSDVQNCQCPIDLTPPVNFDLGCNADKPRKFEGIPGSWHGPGEGGYTYICCVENEIAEYTNGMPRDCRDYASCNLFEGVSIGELGVDKKGEKQAYYSSLCCKENEIAEYYWGKPSKCVLNEDCVNKFEGVPISSFRVVNGIARENYALKCCKENEIAEYTNGMPDKCVPNRECVNKFEGIPKSRYGIGEKEYSSKCCKENEIAEYSFGKPTECKLLPCTLFEGTPYSEYGTKNGIKEKEYSSKCCKDDEEITYYEGRPYECKPREECVKYFEGISGSWYGKTDGIKEIFYTSLCCKENELSTYDYGKPDKCVPNRECVNKFEGISKSRYGIGEKEYSSKCCKDDEEIKYNSKGKPEECVLSACCNEQKPNCPSSCNRLDGQLTLKKCNMAKGFCNAESVTFNFDPLIQKCVSNTFYDACNDKLESHFLVARCGSKCNSADKIQKYERNREDICIQDVIENCQNNKICVEHQTKSSLNVFEFKAECENCPTSLFFNTNFKEWPYQVDGLDIKLGNRDYTSQNTYYSFKSVAEVFGFLDNICQKCSNKPKVFFLNHGNSGFQTFMDDSAQVFDLNSVLQIEKENKYLKTRRCFGEIVFLGCKTGEGIEGKAFIEAVSKVFKTKATASTSVNSFELLGSLMGLCSKSRDATGVTSCANICDVPGSCAGNLESGASCGIVPLETIYYSTNPESAYPGFEEAGVLYQTKLLSGEINNVKLSIADKPDNFKIFMMKDENMPCEHTILDSKIFTLSNQNPVIEFDNLKIEVLPETFSDEDEIAEIQINQITADCENFYKNNRKQASKISSEEITAAQELMNLGYLDFNLYNQLNYLYTNEKECITSQDCAGLLCPVWDLNCVHKCIDGVCEMKSCIADMPAGLDSNSDCIASNKEFLGFIFRTGDKDEKQRAKLWWMD
ncbi:hypothetical protein HYW76_01395 [Candidatus Pacearchaeota archaeon]|nr:hypothetical protein [Candidatus Pacearchaeota archaeon]